MSSQLPNEKSNSTVLNVYRKGRKLARELPHLETRLWYFYLKCCALLRPLLIRIIGYSILHPVCPEIMGPGCITADRVLGDQPSGTVWRSLASSGLLIRLSCILLWLEWNNGLEILIVWTNDEQIVEGCIIIVIFLLCRGDRLELWLQVILLLSLICPEKFISCFCLRGPRTILETSEDGTRPGKSKTDGRVVR